MDAMKTKKEIKKRIRDLEEEDKNPLAVHSAHKIMIGTLEWVLED